MSYWNNYEVDFTHWTSMNLVNTCGGYEIENNQNDNSSGLCKELLFMPI